MADDLHAKFDRLEASLARHRRRVEAMTAQERMQIGEVLESISHRLGDPDAEEAPKDPARFEK